MDDGVLCQSPPLMIPLSRHISGDAFSSQGSSTTNYKVQEYLSYILHIVVRLNMTGALLHLGVQDSWLGPAHERTLADLLHPTKLLQGCYGSGL